MASRKREPSLPQSNLSFRGPSLSPSPAAIPQPIHPPPRHPPSVSVTDLRTATDLGRVSEASALAAITPVVAPNEAGTFVLEELDDYDDAPKLHLVDPPRQVSVIVECLSADRFEVSRLRDNGTTVAAVMYSRKELIELVNRAQAALEM